LAKAIEEHSKKLVETDIEPMQDKIVQLMKRIKILHDILVIKAEKYRDISLGLGSLAGLLLGLASCVVLGPVGILALSMTTSTIGAIVGIIAYDMSEKGESLNELNQKLKKNK